MPDDPAIRLLLVTNTLARGGAEAMLVRLALALHPEAVTPVVICFKKPGVWAGAVKERGIPLHEHLLKHKWDVTVIGRLSRLIRQYRPCAVMAVGSGGDRMFWSALAARRTGVPMVVWSHVFPTPGHHAFEWLNRRLYGYVDAFVALGQRHREALIELEQIPSDRLHVIRNGIDVAPFQHAEQREQARRLLGASDPCLVMIGLIANMRADKRHGLFVEAAARTHAARPQCRFVIIGAGPERPNVERAAATCDPDGAFLTLLGERDDVATLLQGLDIVCLTSEWQECLSIVMLEAMAAGRAFAAPRIGSLDEALIDGETGRFFDPPTPERLSEVLIELIDQPEQRSTLGQRARAKVKAEFTADRMARGFESLLSRLSGGRAEV